MIDNSELMFDLMRLASLQTDSTRVITLSLTTLSIVPNISGIKSGTNQLTHHGNEPDKITELRKIEEAPMQAFGYQ